MAMHVHESEPGSGTGHLLPVLEPHRSVHEAMQRDANGRCLVYRPAEGPELARVAAKMEQVNGVPSALEGLEFGD